jgi:hypothetical protein
MAYRERTVETHNWTIIAGSKASNLFLLTEQYLFNASICRHVTSSRYTFSSCEAKAPEKAK